ncbi:GNAT family N-acetyltransferase [Xanthomonas massiliensis]|jgi:GNAT superfamily N-acetyltransferase|uniref:GNAT family N-acetyltransferase n=1 Tax=Xanthomonas massiliensis TaxID=1720302 RepID=UPI00082701FE|nr:GNAT family N-acetyltransferase [Xanthomonas massiliensis]
MSDPQVRAAVPDDVAVIGALVRELAAYEREPEAARASDAQLHAALFDPGHVAHALVCELDGEVVGLALYFHNFSTWTGRPGLYLEDLFVRESARGRGAGLALLRALARQAVAEGCGRFEWSVLDWNAPAIAFYRQVGARPMDEWTVFRLDGQALHDFAAG